MTERLRDRLPTGNILESPLYTLVGRHYSDQDWRLDLMTNVYRSSTGLAWLDTDITEKGIEIIDLTGTGPESELHRQGVSALLFTGWLACVRQHFPRNTRVFGDVMDAFDVEGRPRRLAFWRRNGFEIVPHSSDHRMRATLGSLKSTLRPRPILDFSVPREWIAPPAD